MSIADVTARIQQLQGQFAALSGVSLPAAQPAPAGVSGTTFADTLDGVTAADPSYDPGTTPAPTGSTSGQAVVDQARQYLGVPYVWGGTDPAKGLDCSGLVQLVYKKFGIDLPRVADQQARCGSPVASLDQAQPGDLLAFGSPVHHIAIYIGGGKMIEAPRTGLTVRVSDVYEKPTAIRRVLPQRSVAAQVTSFSGPARPTPAVFSTGPVPTSLATVPYSAVFQAAQMKYGVPASLLAAVAHQESGYNAHAVSPAGARGLMQLMPGTARSLGVDPDNPVQAIDGAARMLRGLINEFGSVDKALAAYNAGPGAVHRYHGVPPYPETQRYVPAVLGYQHLLEAS